ncbi:ABC transporter permease [Rhodococcus triatomae]|uniref:Peptide/nickel transport system permease protein n=1 Tax=Rhodococcus triatomae TaxID=300028 RepID=A0A1G8DF22_9NOCA|nr:ABC transporter permease [Rhodococcus triatomae]QNG18443.1 ABC transporter permease [Rhodococcus triatomae]QNG21887.1 ABC transporter permease [Rhodococcus triatomae]SDH56184.1 peptide/nickel transport system permease protein [Rhodococcus triatomae]
MTRYLFTRLPSALVVLFLASVAIFLLLRLVPGDPAVTLAGPDATPEAIDAIRSELGLDASVLQQYLSWMTGAVTGDLGRSYQIGGSVGELLADALLNTAVLAGTALLFAIVTALVVSIASVAWPRRWLTALVNGANTLAVALPPFVTGVLFVLVFAVALPILPAGGVPPEGYLARPDITVQYLLLPALCLGLPTAAALTRFLTESLRTEMNAPHVLTQEALGISRFHIVTHGALRAALPPVTTVLGIQAGSLLGGAILVEAIFAWPGVGMLVEQGISRRDYPVVQALLLLSVTVFVAVQLLTDVLNATLDPRIRIGARS